MAEAEAKTAGIGRASALMASGSMVSRALGIVRNALLVSCIGAATPAGQAFNQANTVPNMIFTLLQGGVLTAVLIPQLTKAMKRPDGGKAATEALLTLTFLLIAAVTVLSLIFVRPIMMLLGLQDMTTAQGPANMLTLGVLFAVLTLPQIFFYGAYATWSQVLNVRGRFGITMWTTVFANLVQIVGMSIFLWRFGTHTDTAWTPEMVGLLAGSFTLGIAVQAAALIPALVKSGHSWKPSFHFRGHGFRPAAKLAAWAILAVTLAQLGGVVTAYAINHAYNRGLAQGQMVANASVYYNAFQMFMVPHGIITVSILTALFPRLARAFQAHDTDALRADVTSALRSPALLIAPITVAALALAVPGMAAVSPRMTAAEVNDTALTFSIMALGLLPYGIAGLQQRYSMAREDGRANLWFTLVVVGIQVASALLVLVLPPAVGVFTIAWGQTIGNAVAGVVFLALAQRQLGGLPFRELTAYVARLLAAALVPGLVAWGTAQWILTTYGTVHRQRAGVLVQAYGFLPALGALAVGGVLFVALFLVAAKLFRITELTAVLGRVLGRFTRAR